MRASILAASLALAGLLSACATADPSSGATRAPVRGYVAPMSGNGSSPFAITHPLERGLSCLREELDLRPTSLRFAVGEVGDFTQKGSFEASGGGALITKGGSLMTMSALGQLGRNVRQVERYDMRVAETEALLAGRGSLRDGNIMRQVGPGQFQGSDYYIVGGITEADTNIASVAKQLEVAQIGGGKREFYMNVTVDLRLVRTSDLEGISQVSIRKQLKGQEIRAGVFSFLGSETNLVDLGLTGSGMEPVAGQGVRAVIELATLQLVAKAFDADYGRCQAYAESAFD